MHDYFPEEMQNEHNLSTATEGYVVKINGLLKVKHQKILVLINHINQEMIGYLVINSNINTNIHYTANSQLCQLELEPSPERLFIRKASYIDCTQIRKAKKSKIAELLKNDSEAKRYTISATDLSNIKDMVSKSDTMSQFELMEFGIKPNNSNL